MSDPVVTHASGSRVEHYGQHDESCFGCKLKSLSFGKVHGAARHDSVKNPDLRWETDPVKQRIEELTGVTIDTDHLNKRRRDLTPTD